jgi:excisionase family DNA binding protein
VTKKEAAEYLGVSERSIERFVEEGKLTPKYAKGKTNKIPTFSQEAVEALRKEREANPIASQVPIHRKLTLSPQEAAALSGMSLAVIQKAIKEGKLPLVNEKIKREALDAFIAGL